MMKDFVKIVGIPLCLFLVGCESESKIYPRYDLAKCFFVPNSLKEQYVEALDSHGEKMADYLYEERDLCLCIHLSTGSTVFIEQDKMTQNQKEIFLKLQEQIVLPDDTVSVELR